MNDFSNNTPSDRTKLKKVKRSIRRVPPQAPQNVSFGAATSAENIKPGLKKVKRSVQRIVPMAPQMPQNSNLENSNYALKKVKRPVRKIQPLSPITEPNLSAGSLFEQSGEINKSTVDAFNAESILNISNLPSTNTSPQEKLSPNPPQFIEDEQEIAYGNDYYQVETSNNHKKMIIVAAFAAFVVGFFVSRLFFSEQKVTRNGLQGVVVNAEVPQGRARCGVAEGGQGCVLYLMNPQRQELNARDFYDLAAQLTGRQRFVIETGNMRYSNVKIRPGEIGQFNIPPLTQ